MTIYRGMVRDRTRVVLLAEVNLPLAELCLHRAVGFGPFLGPPECRAWAVAYFLVWACGMDNIYKIGVVGLRVNNELTMGITAMKRSTASLTAREWFRDWTPV
nr:hypothetical protein [Tanacetum cinerariifolium]